MTNHAHTGTVRAAVVQAAPVLFGTPRTLDKLADLTADAARRNLSLACRKPYHLREIVLETRPA